MSLRLRLWPSQGSVKKLRFFAQEKRSFSYAAFYQRKENITTTLEPGTAGACEIQERDAECPSDFTTRGEG